MEVKTPICLLLYIPHDTRLPKGGGVRGDPRKAYCDQWKPVLKFIDEANEARIANICNVEDMNAQFIKETHNDGIKVLKEKYPDSFSG